MAQILIIEDNAANMRLAELLLTSAGRAVLSAVDAESGLKLARERQPDLILMDVVMPNLNGFQATRTISKDPTTSHIPVVLVTTKDQETDKVWGMRQGAKAYVTKPIKEEELTATLKGLLPA